MSDFKGTPGPWIIVSSVQPPADGTKLSAKHIGTFDIKTEARGWHDSGLWVAAVHPYECTGFPSEEEAAANAKLIAAAPDMLNYMILMKNHIEKYVSGNVSKGEVLAEINAIINKATGT
jgi:hypothetical protein